MKSIREQFLGKGDVAAQFRRQVLPAAGMLAAMAVMWSLSRLVEPGWATWWVSTAALSVIWLTAVARVNDIEGTELRWQVRRVGLILVGCGSIAVSMEPFVGGDYPTWYAVTGRVGIALAWLTTPNMPPWIYFILGVDRRAENRTEDPPL